MIVVLSLQLSPINEPVLVSQTSVGGYIGQSSSGTARHWMGSAQLDSIRNYDS